MGRLIVILFLVALVVLLVLALMLLRSRPKPGARPAQVRDDPKEILRRRYAAGEIDEDEYLRRMSGLSQDW
ncbi:SHOCT domain-containing protein [Nonomuraea sp. NPDC046570]|uniref:SHOCT domain-containing protein n=1 Tax=Nonomuraea sp. NPDC046570 TaxID=3155255 RepID=UPI003411DA7F